MAGQMQGALADLLRTIGRMDRRLDALQAVETDTAGGGGGSGTVTSVGLALPAILTVSGSPVTTAGTLTAVLANQSANMVFAGPSSGGATTPTFRALVAADLPAGTGTVTSVALSLPSFLTVSGSPVTTAGTLTAVLATQAANLVFAGPASGSAAAPTFRALAAADLPADVPPPLVLTRTLNGAVGYYVQIGSWSMTAGTHNLRVAVSVDVAGTTSIAKAFLVCCKYAQTAGAWQIVPAIADTGLYTSDFQLLANQSGAAVELRLFSFNGGGGGSNSYTIRVENLGYAADTFSALSGASTMTAPTATLASATDYHAIRGGITLTKTIPTTVGNYVEICQLVNGLGGNPFRISISNSDSGFSNSKQYVIASSYGATAGWCLVAPISDSKYTTAQDYELLINQGGGTTYFRLIRTVGTSAGTAYVQIQWDGAYAGAYGEMTGTGSMAVPTTYAPHNMLTQVGGGVLVKGGYLATDMDTMTYAATITLDVTLGNLHKTTTINATGNATINASAVGKAGQPMWVLIVNDATSGKVITFGTNFKSTGTLTGTVSKQATVMFISDGVSWSEVSRALAL